MAGNTGTGTGTGTGEGTSTSASTNTGTGTTSSAPSSAAQAQAQASAANAAAANQARGEAAAKSEAAKGNAAAATNASTPAGLGFSNLGFNSEAGTWDTGAPTFNLNDSSGSKGPGSVLSTDSANNLVNAFKQVYRQTMIKAFGEDDSPAEYRKNNPELAELGDRAYQEAIRKGKSQEDANFDAQQAIEQQMKDSGQYKYGFDDLAGAHWNFEGQFNKPTYDPSVTAMKSTPSWVADGTSKMSPAKAPATSTVSETPANTDTGIADAPAVAETSDTSPTVNSGFVNRGGTVTDSGSGGTISSGLNPPSRDTSSIGLGTYNEDRANYDQDDWNRGMEADTSSLVSDEACKSFAKRAFLENSEPFKKVRVTIIKKV